MAYGQIGLPPAADLLLVMDAYGAWLKREIAVGLGFAGDTTSAAYYGQQARAKILGDGSTLYGVSNGPFGSAQQQELSDFVTRSRYDVQASMLLRPAISKIDQFIQQNVPTGWSFTTSGLFALDALLTYYNANHAYTPAAPPGTFAVAATTGGAMAECASGACPRVKVSVVGSSGSTSDVFTSQPSSASAQVAIAAPNSALVISGLTGNVPTGAVKLRVYRQLYGAGSGDPYYWLQDVTVVAGTAWSVYMAGGASPIVLTLPDSALTLNITPPSYSACMALPEFATAYALAYASQTRTSGGQVADTMLSLISQGMLSPGNVAFNPVSLHQGYQNPTATGQFGQWVGGTGYAEGTPRITNGYGDGLQGSIGAVGSIQARVTATLDDTAALTDFDYHYFDATHSTLQTDTISGPKSLTATIGDTVDLEIPAGRVVQQVDDVSVGTATTGTFIFEAKVLRAI